MKNSRAISRLRAALCFAAPLILGLPLSQAHAKSVHLKWTSARGAAGYELVLKSGEKEVARHRVSGTSWSGELATGGYTYLVRAYDKVGRLGRFGDPSVLIVTPPAPVILQPERGKEIGVYANSSTVLLKWDPTAGATRYRVEVMRGTEVVAQRMLRETELKLHLAVGTYSWRVYGILDPPEGSLPVSHTGRFWESRSAPASEFKVEKKTLAKASIESPVGAQTISDDGKLSLSWDAVEGAEAYEVRLEPAPSENREPASADARALAKSFTVQGTALEIELPKTEASYVWRVRSVAGEVSGPVSEAAFSLSKDVPLEGGGGRLRLGSFFLPYSYQVTSPSNGFQGSTNAIAGGFFLGGDYWLKPQWGIEARYENRIFSLATGNLSLSGVEVFGKRRFRLARAKDNWVLAAKLGLASRGYFEALQSGAAPLALTGTGVSAELEATRPLSGNMDVSAKAGYFQPVLLSGAPLAGFMSNGTLRLGVEAYINLAPQWAAGAQAQYETGALGFGSSANPEKVSLSGETASAFLLYRFGNIRGLEDLIPGSFDRQPASVEPPAAPVEASSGKAEPASPEIPFEIGSRLRMDTVFLPYSLSITSPASGFQGGTSASAGGVSVGGDYWLKPQWGAEAGYSYRSFQLSSGGLSQTDWSLLGKYRLRITRSRAGWVLSSKLGLGSRSFFEVTPSGATVQVSSMSTLGPSAEIEITKPLGPTLEFAARAAYHLPMTLSGAPAFAAPGLVSGLGNQVLGLSGDIAYAITRRWSLGVSAGYESRSLSAGSPASPEKISMSGETISGFVQFRVR